MHGQYVPRRAYVVRPSSRRDCPLAERRRTNHNFDAVDSLRDRGSLPSFFMDRARLSQRADHETVERAPSRADRHRTDHHCKETHFNHSLLFPDDVPGAKEAGS